MLRMAATTTAQREGHIPQLTLGRRLMLARDDTGLSQKAFAERIGISQRSVVNYECGSTRPKRPVILSWALATGVPLDWLLEGDDTTPEQDFPMKRCTRPQQGSLWEWASAA